MKKFAIKFQNNCSTIIIYVYVRIQDFHTTKLNNKIVTEQTCICFAEDGFEYRDFMRINLIRECLSKKKRRTSLKLNRNYNKNCFLKNLYPFFKNKNPRGLTITSFFFLINFWKDKNSTPIFECFYYICKICDGCDKLLFILNSDSFTSIIYIKRFIFLH